MKKIITLLLLFINYSVKSQNIIIPKEINLEPIDYVEDIKIDNNNFFVAGYTFKVQNYDGYSTNCFLNKFDKNLNLLWSLKLSFTNKSEIYKFEIFNNQIYALVQHGKNTNTTTDTNLYLYIISMKGKVIEKKNIGKCYSLPTNIVIENNKLWFAYSEPSSIYYNSSNIFKPILVEYNLKTNKIIKKKGSNSRCFTDKIILKNSNIYIVGRFAKDIGVCEHFILKFEKNKPTEQILDTEKSEYFLDSYVSNDELVVLTTFPGVYGDLNEYIKYYYVNTKNNSIREKTIYYKDNKWTSINFWTYNENKSTWLIITHDDAREFYSQIDKNGEVISQIPLEKIGNGIDHFIIEKNYQLQNVREQLKITNETRNLKKNSH